MGGCHIHLRSKCMRWWLDTFTVRYLQAETLISSVRIVKILQSLDTKYNQASC